jgi:agmatinase
MSFNPNDVGVNNGNIFGFPSTENEAEVLLIPVPWDATASYGKGSSAGPKAMLEASTQLDFFHPEVENAGDTKVFMTPVSEDWKNINDKLAERTAKYIHFLENGGNLKENKEHQETIEEIAVAQNYLRDNLKGRSVKAINNGQKVGVVGGEHSVSLGLIDALADKYASFGILQIDAHADLRKGYEGFAQSHASIMYNALQHKSIASLVQVAVRDISQSEIDFINSDKRITSFFDWDLKSRQFEGALWSHQCKDIVSRLPQKVYISFDIDCLKPHLCPSSGTPVPGGLEFEEAIYLLFEVVKSGRDIIGFDLCEVAPGGTKIDAIVGARILWNLCLVASYKK